jgi:hypothetical protein
MVSSLLPAAAEIGIAAPGKTSVHEFQVTGVDRRVVVTVSWRNATTKLEMTLQSPNGTMVKGKIAGLELKKEPFAQHIVLTPQVASVLGWEGTWNAQIHGVPSRATRVLVPYSFALHRGVPLKLKLEGLAGIQRVGETAVVRARVVREKIKKKALAEGAGVEELAVTSCTLTGDPLKDGERFEMALRDDGQEPDAEAKDGVYSGRIIWTQPGDFMVAAALTGSSSSGIIFRRDAWKQVEIRTARP